MEEREREQRERRENGLKTSLSAENHPSYTPTLSPQEKPYTPPTEGVAVRMAESGENEIFTLRDGEFDIAHKETLGAGTSGTAYKVMWRERGEYYCVKLVRGAGSVCSEEQEREIRTLMKLNNMFIIEFFGTFRHEGEFYIVTELCTHGTLKSLIDEHKSEHTSIPNGELWKYLIQMMLGLREFHTHSIVHFDIKPANIFLGEANTIKIGDVGSAKEFSEMHTHTSQASTTFQYSAPEFFGDEHTRLLSFPFDMWSVGCVLYELCFLRPPFNVRSMLNLARSITSTEPDYNEGEKEEFIPIIKRLLDKNPKTRMTMDEFFNDPVVRRRGRQVGSQLSPRRH